ncbi:hypothetical protein HPC49_16470 [Pyxidicoccus fallax]|uniref:Uncharacterized protein n=1 Tax=Pyxidicoccus fallax TaxID=394095 RepID=A0A848LNG1_9BACT|nr:nuclease A inhibitor family protein [Pyxidicoccus fallax]NMO19241.1 hypothetical protein [Pyxidicoccus fallax]NPC79812.1 hypothetical protein [Pyxidicoccus fallax]
MDVLFQDQPLPRLGARAVEVKEAGKFLHNREQILEPDAPESVEPGRKWSLIPDALEQNLQELRGIRFGEPHPHYDTVDGQVSVFVVGRTQDGALADIVTGSVET